MEDDQISLSELLNPPYSEPSMELYRDSYYIRTTYGLTSYQVFEPERFLNESTGREELRPRLIKNLKERKYTKQPKFILYFHGITMWSFTFHAVVQNLIDHEFTVILFDFYGRGKSEAPLIQYTLDMFLSQGIDLLDYLRVDSVHGLVGYSMGGCIATHFASTHPQRVNRLLLLAPALPPVSVPLLGRIVVLPYIGKFLYSLFGSQSMLSRLERERFANDIAEPEKIEKEIIDDLVAKVRWQITEKPNYLHAFHSTLCNVPFQSGFQHLFENIPKSIPIYIVLGTKDQIVNFDNSVNFYKQHLPHARIDSVPCGHQLTLEQPTQVTEFITQFLKEPL